MNDSAPVAAGVFHALQDRRLGLAIQLGKALPLRRKAIKTSRCETNPE